MTPMHENECVTQTVAELDRMADATDAQTVHALHEARRASIGSENSRFSRWQIMASGLTAAVVVVLGVYLTDRNNSEVSAMAQQLVVDAELYEEMEFYTWLSEELDSED